jgi:hypothetical protein
VPADRPGGDRCRPHTRGLSEIPDTSGGFVRSGKVGAMFDGRRSHGQWGASYGRRKAPTFTDAYRMVCTRTEDVLELPTRSGRVADANRRYFAPLDPPPDAGAADASDLRALRDRHQRRRKGRIDRFPVSMDFVSATARDNVAAPRKNGGLQRRERVARTSAGVLAIFVT